MDQQFAQQMPNKDEERFGGRRLGNFHKCLVHDGFGEVDKEAYKSFLVVQDPEDVAGLPKISWRKLADRWNEANPEDPYDDERHLPRDFYRTAEAVV